MVIPHGKHRGIERSELLRRFPSYALWAHRTVDWLTLTLQEEYSCKEACIRKSGDIAVRYWQPWINYDELPARVARRVLNQHARMQQRRYGGGGHNWDDRESDQDIYDFGGPW